MALELPGEPRLDTRGLPEGFDPRKFYEYRLETVPKDDSMLESFLWKYIPRSLIKSFAIAIDPTSNFKVSPHQITPANRVKWRQTASVLGLRKHTQTRENLNWAQTPNYGGVSNCWSPGFNYTSANTPPSVGGLRTQDPIADYLKDTTSRTRLMGSDQGTLELFKGYINSPPRRVRSGTKTSVIYPSSGVPDPICASHGGAVNRSAGGYDYYTDVQTPSGSVLPTSTLNALRTTEIAFAKALCQKHAVSMLKGWSPGNRDYTLFRNAVELRDLPRSILQLQSTARDLKQLFVSLGTQPKLRASVFNLTETAKNIPGEYLSFHFGWKQMYKDAMDLLNLPEKMAKRYSFLITRNGKPTTFRSKRTFESAEKDISGFEYDISGLEYGYPFTSTRLQRTCELRLVVNATFDFPKLNVPSFRNREFLDRIGVIPRATDIYNLIPWTWLVDYFTGLGNYVELIDNINSDPGLVNWGMITCRTSGTLTTEFRSYSNLVSSDSVFGSPAVITTKVLENHHTSVLNYECQTRSDVATVLSVKQTSVPSSLTAYQKSIIGALLAQRIANKRGGGFTPSS